MPEDALPETEQDIQDMPVEQAAAAPEADCAAPEEADTADTAALQKQCDELNDRYIRLAAEYDNFRKRSQREREGIHADAVSHAVKALLSTFDNLERALAAETEDDEYKKGVALIYKELVDAFHNLNVEQIEDAPGTAFDPNLHNAVMHIEDDSLGENVISEVFQHGFRIGEKVIRHSMVKVAN